MKEQNRNRIFGDQHRANQQRLQMPQAMMRPPINTGPPLDTIGREFKKGQVVHIPSNAMPAVIQFQVVDILPADAVAVPGRPQMPARVVLSMSLVIPAMPPDNVLHNTYIVMEAPQPLQQAEQQQDGPLAAEEVPAEVADIAGAGLGPVVPTDPDVKLVED